MNVNKMTKAQLIEKIEQLETDFKNEQERADTLSDRISKLEDGDDENYVLIDKDEHVRMVCDQEVLAEVIDLRHSLAQSKLRLEMGIATELDDFNNALGRFIELDLEPTKDGLVLSRDEIKTILGELESLIQEDDDTEKLVLKLERFLDE